MNSSSQRSALILPVRFLRIIFLFCLLLVLTESFISAQHDQKGLGYTDPEQLAITAKRQRLEQDEQNIIVQQMAQCELELKAQKIRRQLEALSFMPPDEIPLRLREYSSEMYRQLKALESQIETMKKSLATEAEGLEENKKQLNIQEEQYKKRMASNDRQSPSLPMNEDSDRLYQQNERLRQEAAQRQRQVAMQNLHLMQKEVEQVPRSGQPPFGISLPPVDANYDVEELKYCEMLEKKVSEKDYDIAEINLLAASGLPGAENLDVEKTLKTLDLWAEWVKHETERHLYKFRKAPEEYSNSEAYFRILMMICTLQEDFKVCYNKDPKMRAGPVEIIPNDFSFFGNSRDLFVHGLTEAEHQGTCASLPVFYVAIGRRLGYPLKLVECKGHLFVRWENAKERFNIEGTSRGLNCYPDQEYMEWPWPISKEELATGMYIKSLSPKRELAAFLEERSLCLKQHKREKQHLTVKIYADNLRKKEGVDLDKLNQLMRQYIKANSIDGTVASALLYQTLTNTNSWRDPGNERDAPGKRTVIAIERFDSK